MDPTELANLLAQDNLIPPYARDDFMRALQLFAPIMRMTNGGLFAVHSAAMAITPEILDRYLRALFFTEMTDAKSEIHGLDASTYYSYLISAGVGDLIDKVRSNTTSCPSVEQMLGLVSNGQP